ncbi:hypothetical protein [Trinickia acidisoli]|uniref:hypothetical protein n=1 Tax=Trinickia acidisoli TaxID=2767482 RepID=UPI001A8FACD0|nr:hypothetical protein [Trinickia acidisoli]
MKSTSGHHVASNVEAMATLSEYLELALDKGAHLVMVKSRSSGTSTLYVGDVTLPDENLPQCGVIQNDVADAILEATGSGFNELNIDGEVYRFMRFFTEVGNQGAVVFAAV